MTTLGNVPCAAGVGAHQEPHQRILLVDDDPTNMQLLYKTLEGEPYELMAAHSGEEALLLCLEARPAMILLDVRMSGIDGFETCRRLKSDPRTRDAAIIFMTALNDIHAKVRGLDVGAVDYITRPFHASELIARVRTHLELRRLNRVLAATNESVVAVNLKLKRDLEAAAKIQQALLPTRVPESADYAFAWRYRPCEELAGDALNVFALPDGQIGLYVLDVSGHGVGAALLAVSVTHSIVPRHDGSSAIMDASTGRIERPALVAERLNQLYQMADQADRYFTLAYGVLDTTTGSFRHVCAGHPAPVLIRGGKVRSIGETNFPIGMWDEPEFAESVIELVPGDRLYLHSDGLVDETNPAGEFFGPKRLRAALLSARNLSLSQSIDSLIGAVVAWKGEDTLSDDVTMVAIERLDSTRG